MYQTCDIMKLLQNLFRTASDQLGHETVMKQFLTPMKPFWAFEANVPKPLIVNKCPGGSTNWLGQQPIEKALIQGTTDVQASHRYGFGRARARHLRFLRLGTGRTPHPALPVLRRPADAICAAAGRRRDLRG